MMNQKDKKIADQKEKIQNRDKLIKYQTNKIAELEALIRQVKVVSSSNRYGNAEVYLRKINELVRPL